MNRIKKAIILLLAFFLITAMTFASPLNYHEGSTYGKYKEDKIFIHGDGVKENKEITVEFIENYLGQAEYLFTMQTLVEPHNGIYKGVSIWELLDETVQIKDNAKKVKIVCADGVSMEFALNEIKKDDYVNSVNNTKLPIILAFAKEGYPLVPSKSDAGYIREAGNDGGPVRLMVGQTIKGERNSTKCLKNVSEIIISISEKIKSFTDVGTFYSWAKDAINYLAEKEIINGVEPGKFAPDKSLTRAEFAKIITKSLNLKNESDSNTLFKDVKVTDWFHPYVSTAVKNGLITGYEDNTFKPDQEVTRQEIIVMIIRAMKLKDEANKRDGSKITYRDKDKIPSWAAGSVEIAEEKDLMGNIAVGYFQGNKASNRAEAAVMVYRMLKLLSN